MILLAVRFYIQVSDNISDQKALERECSTLFQKMVLTNYIRQL